MSESVIVTGTVIKVEAPVAFGSKGFRKATIVIKTEDDKFPQSIPVEASGKKADLFVEANIMVGDTVTASCNLQGREWQNRFFLSLSAWKVESDSQSRQPAPRRDIPQAAKDEGFSAVEDLDTPF